MPSEVLPSCCPRCGAQGALHAPFRPWRFALGLVITLICGLLAVPTLGVSAIFMIWGIMLMVRRPTCRECGWRRGEERYERAARRR